jgi:hypothetical protein
LGVSARARSIRKGKRGRMHEAMLRCGGGPPTEKEARRRAAAACCLARGRAPARDDALIRAGCRGDPYPLPLEPPSVWGERGARGEREAGSCPLLSLLAQPTLSLSPSPPPPPFRLSLSLLGARPSCPSSHHSSTTAPGTAARRARRSTRRPRPPRARTPRGSPWVWLDSPLSSGGELPLSIARALSIRQSARPLRRPPGRLCEWGRIPRGLRAGGRGAGGRREEGRALAHSVCALSSLYENARLSLRRRFKGGRARSLQVCVYVFIRARGRVALLLIESNNAGADDALLKGGAAGPPSLPR